MYLILFSLDIFVPKINVKFTDGFNWLYLGQIYRISIEKKITWVDANTWCDRKCTLGNVNHVIYHYYSFFHPCLMPTLLKNRF